MSNETIPTETDCKVIFPLPACCRLLLLSGCSSIKVVESWNSPPFQGHRYHKMMIVAIAHDENLREMAENILVQEFRRNGVAAVASHTIVKEIDNAKREDIVAAVRSVDADVVLSIRAVSKGSTKITQDGQSGGIYGTSTNVGGAAAAGSQKLFPRHSADQSLRQRHGSTDLERYHHYL